MKKYVVVSDLIINGGEKCTVLKKDPVFFDHITIDEHIVENNSSSLAMAVIKITYNNKDLFRKIMVCDVVKPEKWLTVEDLNTVRGALFRDRLCDHGSFGDGCAYFHSCHCWNGNGCDNWVNFTSRSCSEKLPRQR